MINTYKNISIIYGGSGRKMATCIAEKFESMHFDEYYPIKSYILADDVLPAMSILQRVREVVAESSACIIILTFDDVDHTRVRQNILIEVGMVLSQISEDNCFFLCEKETLPDDFPSDIKGIINPYSFNKDNMHEEANVVCERVRDFLSLDSYRGLLRDANYLYDYTKILQGIPSRVFEEAPNVQMEHILDAWESDIASFDFVSERIIYLLERITFLTIFDNEKRVDAFIDKIESLICPTEVDYAIYDGLYLNNVCRLARHLLQYAQLGLERKTADFLVSPTKIQKERARNYFEYLSIAEDLQEIATYLDEQDNDSCNWLLKVLAYDYAALAYMAALATREVSDAEKEKVFAIVEDLYLKTLDIANACDAISYTLWRGYVQFNLARLYESKYVLTKDDTYLDLMVEYSAKAIIARRKWFTSHAFKGVFASALSFEYFIVCRYEYLQRMRYGLYTDDDVQQVLEGLISLEAELETYCNSTEFGKLLSVRESIGRLKNKVIEYDQAR